MPIICAPPYSEEIKSWSMYTIMDYTPFRIENAQSKLLIYIDKSMNEKSCKWQIQQPPLAEDFDTILPPYTTAKEYNSLPKYKKHRRGIYKRIVEELKMRITSSQIERQRNLEQVLQEARYITQRELTRRREARECYTMK